MEAIQACIHAPNTMMGIYSSLVHLQNGRQECWALEPLARMLSQKGPLDFALDPRLPIIHQ